MLALITGLSLFFFVHAVPSFPLFRRHLIKVLGWRWYRAGFALLSVIGLLLAALGYSVSASPQLWQAVPALAPYGIVFMLPAMLLFAASLRPGNTQRVIAHPQMIAVLLWALYHLLVNGWLSSVLLFGSFALFALLKLVSFYRRGHRRAREPMPWSRDLFALCAGGVAYLLIGYFHPG